MMSDSSFVFMGIPYLGITGTDDIPLTDDLSLVKPNDFLLSARWDYSMNKKEMRDAETASRFLVCKFPLPDGAAPGDYLPDKGLDRFYSGLMAMQLVKPFETLGLLYRGKSAGFYGFGVSALVTESIEHRPRVTVGEWARRHNFTDKMLADALLYIPRIRKVMAEDNAERKNAVTFLQLALENFHPYLSGILCVMGMEAIFDSPNRHEFKRKLCDCLGADTLAFPQWGGHLPTPTYTVGELALPLYMLRNKLAHGVDLRKAATDTSTPVDLLAKHRITPYSEPTAYSLVLSEAACYLLCQVLRKVL